VKACRCGRNVRAGLVDCREYPPDISQKYLAGPSESSVTRISLEQSSMEIVFEFLDGPRQRGLFDMKPLGGPGKMQFLGYSNKTAKVA
jgi:hypothetical protein